MERSSEVSMGNGSDPIDRLRAADPVPADDVPDASLARVSARIQEQIMTDLQHDTIRRVRRPLALFGTLGAAGVLALAIALSSGFGVGSPGPIGTGGTPSTDPGAGGGGVASCLVYDPAALPTFEIVFDGTITAVDGDQVTFDVNTGWKGADGSITLTAPEANVALTGPLPEFAVGGRYLVTAAGSTINACGYTLDYDAQTAAEWGAAFGG
jgi:hypothetical protein